MQVVWDMVLKDLMPPAKGGSEEDPGATCVHWVLSRNLNSESGPCSTCDKTWQALIEGCIADTILNYTQAYACTALEGQS